MDDHATITCEPAQEDRAECLAGVYSFLLRRRFKRLAGQAKSVAVTPDDQPLELCEEIELAPH
jgi:hypothetical protein